MRKRIALFGLLTLLLSTGLVAADLPSAPRNGYRYVFVAPGGATLDRGRGLPSKTILHVGLGGEHLVYKGLGFGAEAGWVKQYDYIVNDNSGPLLSANGLYQFKRTGKAIPFVTSGWSLIYGDGGTSGVNVGTGINYWLLGDKLGVRMEFRDHISNSAHVYGVRIGMVF